MEEDKGNNDKKGEWQSATADAFVHVLLPPRVVYNILRNKIPYLWSLRIIDKSHESARIVVWTETEGERESLMCIVHTIWSIVNFNIDTFIFIATQHRKTELQWTTCVGPFSHRFVHEFTKNARVKHAQNRIECKHARHARQATINVGQQTAESSETESHLFTIFFMILFLCFSILMLPDVLGSSDCVSS